MQSRVADRRILLIGGSSGVGKTSVAQRLGRRLAFSHVLVDDIRIAIQSVTTPAEKPDLHRFHGPDFLSRMSAQQFVDGLIAVGRAITPALHTIVSHHLAVDVAGPLLLEGDGILPALAASQDFADVRGTRLPDISRRVASVFLIEPDADVLLENQLQRSPTFYGGDPEMQRRYTDAIWRYGQWLRAEAERYGCPTVSPRPFATLEQRILDAIAAG